MKVLLLMPSLPPGWRKLPGWHRRYFPPLGIGTLGAILEREGHAVRLADLYTRPWHDFERVVAQEDYDLVGMTCLTPSRAAVFSAIEHLRASRPRTRIVLGGPFATALAEGIVERFPVDAVVVGEAEKTMAELVSAMESGASLDTVMGITFRRGRDVVSTGVRPPISDLDSVPWPAYHLYDRAGYVRFLPGNQHALQRVRDLVTGERFASLVTTRGCDFACEFCAVHVVHGRGLRKRSPGSVADEMQDLHERYGYRYFFFQDAAFPIGSALGRGLCRELIDRRL